MQDTATHPAPAWARAIWPPIDCGPAPTARSAPGGVHEAMQAIDRADAQVREVLLQRCDPAVHSGVLYHDTRPLFNVHEYMPQTIDRHSALYAYALARRIAQPHPHRPGLVRIAEARA
jgi:hypothetical protein